MRLPECLVEIRERVVGIVSQTSPEPVANPVQQARAGVDPAGLEFLGFVPLIESQPFGIGEQRIDRTDRDIGTTLDGQVLDDDVQTSRHHRAERLAGQIPLHPQLILQERVNGVAGADRPRDRLVETAVGLVDHGFEMPAIVPHQQQSVPVCPDHVLLWSQALLLHTQSP